MERFAHLGGSMDIRFAQSARKHRIGKARVLFVIRTCEAVEYRSEGPDANRCMWIGLDDRGLELEVVGVLMPKGVLIIHAMPRAFRRKPR